MSAALQLDGEIPHEVFQVGSLIEQLSPFETHRTWNVLGHSGSERVTQLSSGINLCAASCRWERGLTVGVEHVPGRLEFILGRGPGVQATTDNGESFRVGAGTFHVSQVKGPVHLRWTAADGAHDEAVCLDVDEARLKQLFGTARLPPSLDRALGKDEPYPRHGCRMTPAMFKLLDEVLYCDASALSRRPFLEAKCVELLAVMVQEFEDEQEAHATRLTHWDVERLQRARQILLQQLQDPPRLRELARNVGLNESKLKIGFKQLFGSTVFEALREHRLTEAHRLLRTRRHSVTEVALRVGYVNPSKFAAAFRKHFGVRPSSVS